MKLMPWTLAALLLAGGLSLTSPVAPLEAQDSGCEAATIEGDRRSCTATEEMGRCLTDALDSRRACLQDFDGWLLERACDALFVWDAAACVAKAVVKPF
ncbi:MAG: hypothetical protein EA350_04970 [Gemmatimonadales bacterium]|nr:MAG: hypothetical protein EA350_04970 [Gemmatimonadales bacterium]